METVLWFEVLFGKLETILFVIRTQFPTCISDGMGGNMPTLPFTGKVGIFQQDNPTHQLLKSMAS